MRELGESEKMSYSLEEKCSLKLNQNFSRQGASDRAAIRSFS